MENFKAWGPTTPEETVLEKNNRALARKVAAESIVLLKNENNVLPLKNKEVAIYGAGSRMTIRGGLGSGDMRERYSVNIEDGLKNAGIEILSQSWLDRFDKEYKTYVDNRTETVEEKIKGYTMENVLEMFGVIASVPLKYPIGPKILENDIPESLSTGIYVISRQAGEGHDRKLEKGDFLLDETEIENITLLSKKAKEVVLIVNCGSMIDITPVVDLPNVNGVLYIGQGGTEGGNAVADILTGKETPSAKLVDTWAKKYEDFPSHDTFSYLNNDLEDENYSEGIYVGYRYFSTFDVKPLYEFGYGLSYTNFDYTVTDTKIVRNQVTVAINVKNTGLQFSGKEIVQLYLSKPGIKFESEKMALCGFAKTKKLSPNEETTINITFNLDDFGVFNEKDACWLLEKGEYTLLIGNSSENVEPFLALDIDQDILLEKVDNICPVKEPLDEISREGKSNHVSGKNLNRLKVNSNAFTLKKHEYKPYEVVPSEKTKKVLPSLTIEDKVLLCVGAGQFDQLYNLTPGVAGSTTASLLEKGIPNITMSDGPAGLNVLTETVILPSGVQLYLNQVPESNNWGFIKEMSSESIGTPESGRPIYQYMTAWPAVVNQAQTWDKDLINLVGKGIGEEMLSIGASLWLAPAINIHRNPLCGRNFEYYSEDPVLTGVLSSSIIKGVESFEGVGVTLKHFCCNNQEDNRDGVSSNVSERTLREIYVKAFKYVIRESQPKTIMSSYNKVNGVYTSNNYDLLTKLLRNEFGFNGVVMTDWNAASDGKSKYSLCQVSGNDLIMPGYDSVRDVINQGLKDGSISEEVIERSAINVLNLVFSSATAKDF